MQAAIPIPAALTGRPRFAGLPVPYFVATVAGRPDFRLLDPARQRACFVYGKCGICGQATPAPTFLICGPLGLQNRVHTEPPVHEACARYALANCPYLSRENGERRTDYPAGARESHGGVAAKPTELLLVELDKRQVLRVPTGQLLNFRPRRTQRFYYEGGVLVEDPAGWVSVPLGEPWRQQGL